MRSVNRLTVQSSYYVMGSWLQRKERVGVNSKKNDGWKESQNKPVIRVNESKPIRDPHFGWWPKNRGKRMC